MKPKLDISGAIESNAGDDYHILWACRRALNLLEPNSGLSFVKVEGVSREDEAHSPDADAFLGVDLSEYYGGSTLTHASRVVFSQLKYSHRHPDRPWTAARLCEPVRGAVSHSVIARLAQAFSGFNKDVERSLVIARLQIKLVSNRPAAPELLQAIGAAQIWLKDQPEAKTAGLLAAIPAPGRSDIERLKKATALTSGDFCDFLRCLDFSDCNSDGRLWQRLRLIQDIGRMAPASPAEKVRDLYAQIAAEALPKVGERGLKREDVLAALGCHGPESLFPAPEHFERLANPLPPPDAQRILEALRASPSRRLLVHGAGGVGKTTTVLSLPEGWPQGRCVYYDCFGNGTYKNSPGDERHSHRRALLQLSNQLAVQCGSPFLIQARAGREDLWLAFRQRLAVASDILRPLGESLILVIDAADNSIQAADTPDDSFVVDLWKIPRPDNVYLLMTARSGGRAQSLQAPGDTPDLELLGFSPEVSERHLRQHFPAATAEEAAEFHKRSHGNPRVQSYALQSGLSGGIAAVLEHSRRKLEEIFQDYVEAAITLQFGRGAAADHLDDLSCFPRPLHQERLAEILGLPNTEIEALCAALSPGLTRNSDGWGFRDEDFDTFLQLRLEARGAQAAHRRLALRMAALPDNEFAARHLAEHWFRAGDDPEVIDIALQDCSHLPRQLDEVAQVQLLRRRLVLGIKSAARTRQNEALVRLTIRAADASRSDYAVLQLITEHPDLAALYADPQTIAKHHLNAENHGWFGSAQLRCAALFARYPEHQERAREHLCMAEAWLRRRHALAPEERNRWDIKARDIAAGAEAAFRLFGPEAADRWLRRWRPLDAVLHACRLLAEAIAPALAPTQQTELFQALQPHPLAAVLFLVACRRAGQAPEAALVEAVLAAVEAYSRLRRHSFLRREDPFNAELTALRSGVGIEFAELLAAYDFAPERIARLLQRITPPSPNFAPHNAFDANRSSPQLQVLALSAELTGKEPTQEELEQQLLKFHDKTSDYDRGQERQRFHDMVGARFQLYRLRAEAIVRRPEVADLEPRLTELLHCKTEESWRYGGQGFDFYLRDALEPLTEAALACAGNAGPFLKTVTNLIGEKFPGGAHGFWIDLAGRMLRHPQHCRQGLKLLEQAVRYLAEHPISGQDYCSELMRAAAFALPHDQAQGADYFHQAVNIARELNDDLCERLKYLALSAAGLKQELTEAEARDLSARLARLTEETRIFVTRDDGYPWDEIFQTILELHAPSGYALFTRWTDLRHLGLRSDVGQLSRVGLVTDRLQHNQALGLLRLGWDGYGTAKAFQGILSAALAGSQVQAPNFRKPLRKVVQWVLRDISREERGRAAQDILDWMSAHRCAHLAEAQPLRDYLAFLAAHPQQDGSTGGRFGHNAYQRATAEEINWDEYIGTEPIPPRLPLLLARLRQLPGYQSNGVLFEQVRRRLMPSEKVAYLQALVELPDERWSAHEYLDEWETCLREWQSAHSVRQWAETGIPELARRHLPGILGYPYQVHEYLRRFLQLPFVKPERWLELLAPALADWAERLGAWQLYALAGVLANGLESRQRKTLLDEAIVQGEDGLAARRQQSPLPDLPPWQLYGNDQTTPFATLLYTVLGQPDTRIRWSCLHALRDMDLQDDPALLAALIQHLEVETVGAFLPPDVDFLWMSARAYLMIFLARLAQDHPHALLPHITTLQRHAFSKDFPHAQIRELAKRALLAIEDNIPGSLDTHIRRNLEALNHPKEEHVDPSHHRHLSDGRQHEGRFNFNPMDTLPYWFAPLGRRFNLGGDEIADLAEKWICDRWGFFGRNEPRYRKQRRDRDWYPSTNNHGSLPTIEAGRVYLEYHAMQLVAGELADSQTNVVDSPDSEYDQFGYWLCSHLPTHCQYWLSELRDPTPLEAQLHGIAAPREGWLHPRVPDEFDACLGLGGAGNVEFLHVAAEVDIHESERREHHRIESALVSPETAHALLRALQAIGDPHPYRIPPAGDDLEIEEPGFSLRGWIGESSVEKEFDAHDPLLYGLNTGLPLFPQAVLDQLNIVPDSSRKRWFDRTDSSLVVAEITTWSEPHEDKERAQYSSGWRLRIKTDRLLRYLQAQQRCLILEVQINREEHRYGEKRTYDYKPPAVLLYLLHPDGRLETLEHHHRLGPAHS